MTLDFVTRFRTNHTLEQRLKHSSEVLKKHPSRVPILVERDDANCPEIDKNKFLCPTGLTVHEFLYVLRLRLKIKADQAIFLSIEDKKGKRIMPRMSSLIGEVYNNYKSDDNFLIMRYSIESTFG